MTLKQIKLMPAREQAASSLRKAILAKELEAGTIITLDGISKQLGLSITPVREAFQILANENLIKLRPNKGAIVLGIDEKAIIDHYETRGILESEVVYKICKNNADISKVLEAYENAVQSLKENNFSDYSKYNQSFHYELWTAGGNDKIRSLLSSMWNGLSMGSNVKVEEYAKISINEHRQIVEALKERDADKAKLIMCNHIKRSLENILTHYNK
ncbi:GntR family transcriptional regulator [Clostridium sp. Marseille-P299]|uniref:GntR family transcriptional regulator n=1 Tax=Clostridium sp. Marseille-P299 TaxID=1805477 RepID=UPI0008314A8A|nr:GntR family transcriptional regulator [Clostridium sp. Marseille-P299]